MPLSLKYYFKEIDFKNILLLASSQFALLINMQGIQSLMPFIREEFDISRTLAGFYATFMFVSAAVIAVYSGSIVDKVGAKKSLLLGIFSVGVVMIIHGLVPFYFFMLILAFFLGLGSSIIVPSTNKAVLLETAPEKRATAMGILHSGTGIGGFVGAIMMPVIASRAGWRKSVIIAGSIALIFGFLIFKRLKLIEVENENYTDRIIESFGSRFKKLLKNKQLMLNCGLGLLFGVAFGAIPAHYTLYLTLDLYYSEVVSGIALGLVQLGGVAGQIFWGWISDVVFNGIRDRVFLIIMVLIVIIKMLNAFGASLLTGNIIIIFLSSFFLGAAVLGWLGLFFTAIGESVQDKQIGIASGVSLFFIRLGALIGPPIFGYIGDVFNHYHYSWLLFGLIILVLGLLFNFLSHKQKQAAEEL